MTIQVDVETLLYILHEVYDSNLYVYTVKTLHFLLDVTSDYVRYF